MAAQADFLLDSDVLIWTLRKRSSTPALVATLKEESGRSLGCSALNVPEVWAGVKPGEEQATEELFAGLDVLAVDGRMGRSAAGLLSAGARRSPRDWIDAVIAATALSHGRTLVTYNTRHYPYPDLKLHPIGGSSSGVRPREARRAALPPAVGGGHRALALSSGPGYFEICRMSVAARGFAGSSR